MVQDFTSNNWSTQDPIGIGSKTPAVGTEQFWLLRMRIKTSHQESRVGFVLYHQKDLVIMDYGQFVDIEAYEFPSLVEGNRDERKQINNWYMAGNQPRYNNEGFIVLVKMILRLCRIFGA